MLSRVSSLKQPHQQINNFTTHKYDCLAFQTQTHVNLISFTCEIWFMNDPVAVLEKSVLSQTQTWSENKDDTKYQNPVCI